MRVIDQIILHHTGAPATQRLAEISAYHRQKNWGTFLRPARAQPSRIRFPWGASFIQYHYVIGADGTTTPTREHGELGWHAAGANDTSLGICLLGDFRTAPPTNAQLGALKTLLRTLIVEYKIAPARILRHSAVSWTTCPGKNFPVSLLASIVNAAMELPTWKPSESLQPGELVKNANSPKVYVVGRSGTPLWVVDEATFAELYGDFAKVRTVQMPLASTKVLRITES